MPHSRHSKVASNRILRSHKEKQNKTKTKNLIESSDGLLSWLPRKGHSKLQFTYSYYSISFTTSSPGLFRQKMGRAGKGHPFFEGKAPRTRLSHLFVWLSRGNSSWIRFKFGEIFFHFLFFGLHGYAILFHLYSGHWANARVSERRAHLGLV